MQNSTSMRTRLRYLSKAFNGLMKVKKIITDMIILEELLDTTKLEKWLLLNEMEIEKNVKDGR